MTTASGRTQVLDEPLLLTLEDRAGAWAGEVGHMLLDRYGTLMEVEYKAKDDRSPVTAADRDGETMLREDIARPFEVGAPDVFHLLAASSAFPRLMSALETRLNRSTDPVVRDACARVLETQSRLP